MLQASAPGRSNIKVMDHIEHDPPSLFPLSPAPFCLILKPFVLLNLFSSLTHPVLSVFIERKMKIVNGSAEGRYDPLYRCYYHVK
jgi:hypothetical protein